MTRPTVVWSEIPVTDMDRAISFYNSVFGYQMKVDNSGPNPMAILGNDMQSAGGHLYPGQPSKDGSTVHIALPDALEAAIDRCKASGGSVVSEPIQIPAGRFVYALDTEGNSIGLFEGAA